MMEFRITNYDLRIYFFKKFFITFSLLLTTCYSFAQIEKGDKFFADYKYAQAIPFYKPLADSGNIRAVRKIAECYRKINEYENAEKYYAIVVADKNAVPKSFLYYGQALMNNGKYEDAKIWLKKFIATKPDDDNLLAKNLLESCDKARDKNIPERKVIIKKIKWLNTAASDFCAVPYEEGILFTSTREGKINGTSGSAFQKVFYAKLSHDTAIFIEPVHGVVNTKNFNSGPACVNTSQDIIYFTKNNFQYGDAIANKKGDVTLKIFSAQKSKEGWKDIKELELNDKEYSCAFPSINKQGDMLYFTSDRGGGYGGKDIYYSTYIGGKWSKPKNAGKNINTSGDERYPFIHADGTLFFSSNGLQGYGGMDIYKCVPNKIGEFGKPENLGKQFNSSTDDFGFYLDDNYDKGYFSSDKNGGEGSDDIYSFEYLKIPLELTVYCDGKPTDHINITITKNEKTISDTLYTSKSVFELDTSNTYLFTIAKDGYTAQQINVKTGRSKKPVVTSINLTAIKKEEN
jgi:tetratricopeptide (TPR) repeat protein